jgi:undecaprenyl-diphosphatase
MDFLQILILALIQGLTEFLPISSAAHLILLPVVAGWEDQGLAFDVAVHVGTLAAVVTYFRRELIVMIRDWIGSVTQRRHTADSRLAWGVIFGTIPAGLAGLMFKGIVETELRSALVIALATIGFGLLLWWADARGRRDRDEHTLRIRDILLIGCAQALALIPGTSRSGITIMAGLMLGLTRQAAARFSFLLSIPVIALAGGWQAVDVLRGGNTLPWMDLVLGAAISGFVAYWTIHFFIELLGRIGLLPFIIYRLLLGVVLLVVFYL